MNDPLQELKDIDRRKTEEELLQTDILVAIPEALPDAIVVVDRAGFIRFVNSRTELMLGYTRSELIGQLVEILIPQTSKDKHPNFREHDFWDDPRPRLMGAGRILKARDRDGRELSVEISLAPLITKHGRFVITLLRRIRDGNQ